MKVFKNIAYDIKAIRKYGLITHIKYLFDHKKVIINLHTHLDYVPQFKEDPYFVIKEVNIYDPKTLKKWAEIINKSFRFETPYNLQSAKTYLENHLYKEFEHMFFLYDDEKPIGSCSIGCFKKNKAIGSAGRLAIIPEYQKRGLGSYLILYALNQLRDKGYKVSEHVFEYRKSFSYRQYFKLGAVPEFNKKQLQLKPTRKFFLVRLWAQYKVKKMYKEVLRKRNEAFLS